MKVLMKNILPVGQLDPTTVDKEVSSDAGMYRWWFDEAGAQTLLKPLNLSVPEAMIQTRTFDGQTYYALYFGISPTNLRDRIKWHLFQKHTASSISSGALSTFRHTLCALLGLDSSVGEQAVNDFLCQHALLEWEDHTTPGAVEKQELSAPGYYYPLNIQESRSLPQEVKDMLKHLREIHKK